MSLDIFFCAVTSQFASADLAIGATRDCIYTLSIRLKSSVFNFSSKYNAWHCPGKNQYIGLATWLYPAPGIPEL